MGSDTRPAYILGDSEHELLRLERQAQFFAEATENVLRRAGLQQGMHVLDIGCGAGDVSLIAAKIVGDDGRVVGIDQSLQAIATAERRAAAAQLGWITFLRADLNAVNTADRYDAVVGRFILLYVREPSKLLCKLARHIRSGGILAFLEMDLSSASIAPQMTLFEECLRWIVEVYRRCDIEPDMGSKLYSTFRKAGLSPHMSGTCTVEGGPDAFAYDLLSATVRSLLPSMEALRVATADAIRIDDLAERMRKQAAIRDHCIVFPRLIGAWARVNR